VRTGIWRWFKVQLAKVLVLGPLGVDDGATHQPVLQEKRENAGWACRLEAAQSGHEKGKGIGG